MWGYFHMRTPRIGSKQTGYYMFFLLATVFLIGILVGAIAQNFSNNDNTPYLLYYVKQILSVFQAGNFISNSGYLFLSCMALQTLLLFFSLSCIGVPVILFIPFCKGFSIGCVSAYLYTTLELRGIAANLLIFWLPDCVAALILLIFTRIALDTSYSLFCSNILGKGQGGTVKSHQCLRVFLITSLGYLPCAVWAGIAAAIFAPVFLK